MNRRDAIKRTALIMGYAVSATAMAGVLSGCQADAVTENWKPKFFSDLQVRNVAEAAERILPKTDTPGAKDVMVERFIDRMLGEIYKPEKSTSFKSGIDKLEADAQATHKKSFADLDDAQKDAMLTSSMNAAKLEHEKNPDAENKPFFHQLKELTFLGFFTSEKIGKEVFVYDPVPGSYQGCIPLEGNSFAF